MYTIDNYVIVGNPEDFMRHWDKNWSRFNGAVSPIKPSNLSEQHFPLVMKYIPDWDPRCCGSYTIVNKNDPVPVIKARVKTLKEILHILGAGKED